MSITLKGVARQNEGMRRPRPHNGERIEPCPIDHQLPDDPQDRIALRFIAFAQGFQHSG